MTTPVIPYRGIETHGVKPDAVPDVDPDEADYGATRAVPIEPEDKEPDPIPVKIVSGDSAKEINKWSTYREVATGNSRVARRVVGYDENRSGGQLKNMHAADTLYVFPDNFTDIGYGWPIAAGATFDLSDTEVWALAGGANDIPIAVMVKYTVSA